MNDLVIKDAGMPVKEPFAQKWWAVLKQNAGWQGPYKTLEDAQREAVRALARDPAAWEQYFVVELVGTVTKPLPDMMWHEPKESKKKSGGAS